jgi:tRNA (guanine-N7-)-methyltransferase
MNRYKKKVKLKDAARRYFLAIDRKALDDKTVKKQPVTLDDPVDFAALFGNRNPVELEIGFGTGRFILDYAARHPDVNLVGIEITRKVAEHAANKLLKAGLENVRLAICDARLFLKAKTADRTVSKIHVYFPDPWVKKRHVKRRVINQDFLHSAFRVLAAGGRLYLFTDHRDYFDYFLEHSRAFGRFREDTVIEDYTPTSYELKWVRQGRTIYRAVLQKP